MTSILRYMDGQGIIENRPAFVGQQGRVDHHRNDPNAKRPDDELVDLGGGCAVERYAVPGRQALGQQPPRGLCLRIITLRRRIEHAYLPIRTADEAAMWSQSCQQIWLNRIELMAASHVASRFNDLIS